MIKYEEGMLVLDSAQTKEDQESINVFIEHVKWLERYRILQGMQKLEDQSHATRTPLYQDTLFPEIRRIILANTR